MYVDLSWSHHLKTDAPTLVKEIRSEVKRHMDLISSHMSKFDNVIRALNEGNRVLGNTLCHKCLHAVKSKRMEIQAKNYTSHKKKKLMKLSPECQQIVNNVVMKSERSQSENPSNEEYCTQEEYYQQEIAEMQNLHTDKIMNMQEEIEEMEKKYKKEVKDKEAEEHDLRKQLEKMTFDTESCKINNANMSKKLKSYEKTESELRELKHDHKRLKEDLDRKECIINKLKREYESKEEDNRRNRRSSSNFLTRPFAGNRDNELTGLKEELNSKDKELQASRREKEKLKSELDELLQQNRNLQEEKNFLMKTTESRDEELQSSRRENENLKSERDESLQRNRNLQEEKKTLKETIDSTCEELQESNRDNETLKSEQIKLIGSLQEEKRTLKEKLGRKVDEVNSMKSELEVLQKAKRKEIAAATTAPVFGASTNNTVAKTSAPSAPFSYTAQPAIPASQGLQTPFGTAQESTPVFAANTLGFGSIPYMFAGSNNTPSFGASGIVPPSGFGAADTGFNTTSAGNTPAFGAATTTTNANTGSTGGFNFGSQQQGFNLSAQQSAVNNGVFQVGAKPNERTPAAAPQAPAGFNFNASSTPSSNFGPSAQAAMPVGTGSSNIGSNNDASSGGKIRKAVRKIRR